MIPIIPYSHYYWVWGPPNIFELLSKLLKGGYLGDYIGDHSRACQRGY